MFVHVAKLHYHAQQAAHPADVVVVGLSWQGTRRLYRGNSKADSMFADSLCPFFPFLSAFVSHRTHTLTHTPLECERNTLTALRIETHVFQKVRCL